MGTARPLHDEPIPIGCPLVRRDTNGTEGAIAKITLTKTSELVLPEPTAEANAPERRFALVLYSGEGAEVVELAPGVPVVVGRDFPSEVQIDDPAASRQHARFLVADGAVRVEDLGSRNGTLRNGVRIEHAVLGPGDEVVIGSTRITVTATRARSPGPAAAGGVLEGMVVVDPAMVRLYEVVARAARSDAPVLILGETGTGKEHVARALHRLGDRQDGPFSPINCAAIPGGLTESILFGHEKGSFTGADRRSLGVFEQAKGGVVFLDEIGELPAQAQAVLLRVLETKRLTRVGGNEEIAVDVRVVAATHCDVEAMIAEGSFREDLFYRLNAITLEVPPLRARPREIAPMVELFVSEARAQWELAIEGVEPAALAAIEAYAWPGNVRQLRNAIERACLLASGRRIGPEDLPAYVRDGGIAERGAPRIPSDAPLKDRVDAFEGELIRQALQRAGGNRRVAAKLLRVPLRTLFRKLKQYTISDPS